MPICYKFIHQLNKKIKLDGIEGQIGVEAGGQVSKRVSGIHTGEQSPLLNISQWWSWVLELRNLGKAGQLLLVNGTVSAEGSVW